MLKIEELRRKIEKCPQMDKNVHLRTGPKWTSHRGITLIALVITIIILLILAGITIGAITGNNGLIKQAGEAKEDSEIANEKEVIDNATIDAMGKNKYGNLQEGEFQEALDRQTGEGKTTVTDIGESFEVYFTDSERYYEVDLDGNIGDYTSAVTDPYPGDITVGIDGEVLDGETEETAYQIWCIEDLCAFSKNVRNGERYQGKIIKLMTTLNFKSDLSYSDKQNKYIYDDTKTAYIIDKNSQKTLKELITDENGMGFIPIGTDMDATTSFRGIFDGNNNSIKNIFQKQENKLGLFSGVRDAIIKNITVTGSITSTNCTVGGICGEALNTEIINCHNKATIIEEGKVDGNNPRIGGIIGRTNNCEIINCSNTGNVKGDSATGGITGECSGSVINCYNLGNITGGLGANYGAVGGIVGINRGSSIYNCFNTGEITSNNTGNNVYASAGGILGSSEQTGTNCKIINSYNVGKVNYATRGYGAIVGGYWYQDITNTATLKNTFYQEDGDLLGYGEFPSAQGIEKKTQEYMHSENLVTDLNNYIENNTDKIDTSQWRKWRLGEDNYPIFE